MQDRQPGKLSSSLISPAYLSYLVRLWRSANSPEWLASLEEPGTHERHNFADLASFFAFLQAQTGVAQAAFGSSEEGETKDPPSQRSEPP